MCRVTEPASFGGKPLDWELRDAIAEARGILDDMELGILDRSRPDGKRWSLSAYDLFNRARVRSRDKLPQPDRGRRAIGVHGDPTASEAGTRVEDNDEDLKHWHALQLELRVAMGYLRRVTPILAEATPAQQHPDRIEVGCRICSRPGKPEPVYRGTASASERCRWCYDFWTQWGVDAPAAILKLRRDGKRITEQLIRAEEVG